jgi:SAM dependent carboxyl methyltransferase
MKSTPVHDHGVMEGKGSYNRYSRIPAGGMSLALPRLQEAVQKVELDRDEQPVVVADYGSSQGKNSLAPMRVAIRTLRERLGPDRPIFVFHVDQPTNDFNTLFEVVSADPERYVLDEPNIFPCAIGRSFYEGVFPQRYVHLGWSSFAAMWLSRIPTLIPGHFIALCSTGAAREAFERQAEQDWEAFLSLRARELRPGGRLVVVLAALNDDGISGLEDIFNRANAVLAEMVDTGAIQAEERERMVLGAYPRRRRELLAPFHAGGHFQNLRVESCDLTPLPDSAWADYDRDGNVDALATKHALFFRSVFVPTLALALTEAHDADQRRVFADRFENGLKRHLVDQPAPLHSFVQTMVLAKQ